MQTQGALVGWVGHSLGDRVGLTIESFGSSEVEEFEHPDRFYLLMSAQQAAVLGNYLIEISGQTPPSRNSRNWFRRFFG